MNAIEILGGLLGASRGGKGGGSDILSEILTGGRRGSGNAPSSPSPSSPSGSSSSSMDANDLEDLLGIGRSSPPSRSQPVPSPAPAPRQAPTSSPFPTDIFGQKRSAPKSSLAVPRPAAPSQQDQAVLLIRAMINAAKVDGEITDDEQQTILKQVGDTSAETVQFLRAEFARPIDLAEFAKSTPIGLEQQVYSFSLLAMKLDSTTEADYMRELATALRLSPDICNQIHSKHQVSALYQ